MKDDVCSKSEGMSARWQGDWRSSDNAFNGVHSKKYCYYISGFLRISKLCANMVQTQHEHFTDHMIFIQGILSLVKETAPKHI